MTMIKMYPMDGKNDCLNKRSRPVIFHISLKAERSSEFRTKTRDENRYQ